MMKKFASAQWEGTLKQGKGSITSESQVLKNEPYGFNTRFEGSTGTNPEELIGAAHAACFSMALSMLLGEEGFKPQQISTQAAVTLDKDGEGFAITAIHLDVKASVPEIDQSRFEDIANKAKAGCPVSKVLNADITMDAQLK